MSLEYLLHATKDELRYPPSNFYEALLESPQRPRNITRGDVPEITGRHCLYLVREVLSKFVDRILKNSRKLGLTSEIEIQGVVNNAIQEMFLEARGLLAREFSGQWEQDKQVVMLALDNGRGELEQQLHRKIKVRHLDLEEAPMASIRISGSHNVNNIVLGSVGTSIQNLIARGGPEQEAARLIDELVLAVKELDEKHQKKQTDLLNLVNGLIKEIEKEAEERNPSVMEAILDRIKSVGSAMSTATALHKFIAETLPQLARLLGIGG
ncbi:MAG: hypothetical protein A4E19_18760 [Nitrospira sp. SG-bin1]|nr:MAG: hypothetical protein A4E19_18760 [Nitrospira sp. SG-bin1]